MFTARPYVTDNINKRQRKRSFVQISASGANIPLKENWLERWCSLPIDTDYFKRLVEFSVKEDDVYVITFPKCGTTWIQEASWLLMNHLDFKRAKQEDLHYRSVFMELSAFYTHIPNNTIQLAEQANSPRVLKSHLPAHLIPPQIWQKNSKIIYCARNPKDMAVSYFHFHRGLGTWQGSMDEFVEDLLNNDIMYSPYWEHVMDFWLMREKQNICFLTYEDMKRDLRSVLFKLNRFLERPDLSEQQLQHLAFKNMKANRHVNPTFSIKSGHGSPNVRSDFEFMRRGIVGSYKDELSPETNAKLDKWIEDHLRKYNIKLEDIFGSIVELL